MRFKNLTKRNNTEKGKHLSYEQRTIIESMLTRGSSIREISKTLEKAPSTISREIERNSVIRQTNKVSCINKTTCKHHGVCGNKVCRKLCYKCIRCTKYCSDFKPYVCQNKVKNNNLCNSCMTRGYCKLEKRVYDAVVAQNKYSEKLVMTRSGFDITEQQLAVIDDIVSPAIKKGLSPYHVIQTYSKELPVSESTLRRLIATNNLGCRNIDLRNQVKRKQRKPKSMHNEIPLQSKIGHLYKDYLHLISENDINVVEMDCVEGKREDTSVLLTLHFPAFHMQLAYKLEKHTSKCVVECLDWLEQALGKELFSNVFEVILTDNGHEFSNLNDMERSIYGGTRTKVF